jgi:hypothetical protein
MVTDDTTLSNGQAEMHGVCRRSQARADSVLLREMPEMQSHIHAAARLIEQLISVRTEVLSIADETPDEEMGLALRALAAGGAL